MDDREKMWPLTHSSFLILITSNESIINLKYKFSKIFLRDRKTKTF